MGSHLDNPHDFDRTGPSGRVFAGLVATMVALVALTGCTGGSSPTKSYLQKKKKALQTPADEASGDTESADGEATSDEKKQFEVKTLKIQTRGARAALDRHFEGFMEREPLGFGVGLFGQLRSEAEALAARASALPEKFRQASPLEVFRAGVPFLVLALFGAAFLLLSRQISSATHRLQAEFHLDVTSWGTRVLRGLVLIAGRCLPPLVLLLLSYFPTRAIFTGATWAQFLSDALWLGLAYRAIASLLVVLFSGRVLWLDDADARRLERITVGVTRLVFVFLVADLALARAGYPEEIRAFVDFLFRVTLVAVPIVLYVAKSSVLALFPEDIESRLYSFFARVIGRNYEMIMVVTAVLLAMRAAGWERSASFILLRGYAIVALLALVFTAARGLRYFLRRQVDKLGETDESPLETDRSKLTRRIEQLVGVGLGIGVIALILRLLLLLEPTVMLLHIPFVAIGNAKISFMSLLNLGLVVLGTVLAFKLLRATLNAQIYPLLEIDVGVAYAVNTIIKYILVVVSFLLGMYALGVDLTALTVVMASLGVGIGFGLQTLVENLISGFIILFGQSVQKGDFITVDEVYGQVEAVGARSVIIKTPDNYEMLVPSKEIVSGRIINWSYDDDTVRARLPVGVSYSADPDRVRDVLESVCDRHDLVLDRPEPRVRLAEFGDSSVNFELLFFFDCRETTERQLIGDLNFEVWDALQEAGITIPFPQRDLNFKGKWARPPEGWNDSESE